MALIICMLTNQERDFLRYWEANREQEKKVTKQLLVGIPIGLLFAVPILVLLLLGRFWYKRAEMTAHALAVSPVVIIAVLIITVFVAIFYKRQQWDMREQQYLSLKAREEAGE